LDVVAAAIARGEQVGAGFEAVLVVTALGAEEALKTSGILFLELGRGGEDALAFFFPFLLVTRVKVTSSTSGTSTSISTLEDGVGIGLGPYTVLIASAKVGALV